MRKRIFIVYGVLAIAIMAMAASLFWLIVSAAEEARLAQADHRDNLVNMSAQVNYERLTLLDTLDRFEHGDVPLEEVLLRFDIFWSRLETNSSGAAGRYYLNLPGAREALEEARRALEAIEPRITDLRPGEAAKIAAIKTRLRSLAGPLHEITLTAVGDQAERSSAAFQRRKDSDRWFLVFLIGVLAAGAVLVILLGTERHRLNALSRSLERRVAERTEALSRSNARLEQALAETALASRQAEAANKAKSDFLATISHELRTPLNAVIGFSHMMMSEALGPIGSSKYRDYASDIHDSGQHLLGIINDILDVTKIEAGSTTLNEGAVRLEELIDSTLRLVNYRAQGNEIKIENYLERKPSALWVDERKIKQSLVNLISNAVKFTPDGGLISLTVSADPDGDIVIDVRDTGIGIAADEIPKVLAPFGQVDSDLNRRYEGTGLGLPLAKSLVELHGGSLDLESTAGVGTTVTVRLPGWRIVAADLAEGPDVAQASSAV